MNLTDTADAATELQSRTVWTEMVLNGNASNGTRVDGVTTARGGFDFFHSDPLPQHVIDFGAEATLEAGDRVEIVYNDTGSLLHDHGNTNVFLGVVPAPATAGLLAAGALIGLRRKR